MQETSGSLHEHSGLELLRELYLQKETGVLELSRAGRQDRLYFVVGDLYLSPGHRASRHLRGEAGSPGDSGGGSGVIASVIESLAEWAEGEYAYEDGVAGISSNLTGPFPTGAIVMAASVYDSGEEQLLRLLGGEECRFAAVAGRAAELNDLKLHPHEAFLLSRLESPVSVRRLLRQGDLDKRESLERLRRLQAVDLIRQVERIPQDDTGGLLTPEILKRFSERVQSDLERQPLALAPGGHKERVSVLLRGLGERNFYELLELDMSATPDEIHSAYMRLARLVHPSHQKVLSLQRPEGLELLFERATEAYLTLSDGDRSRRYLAVVGPQLRVKDTGPTGAERVVEQRGLAQKQYLSAQEFIMREEFHFAMELLQQAVRVSPRAEYYTLLAECAERNPRWTKKAILYYNLALDLAPEDVDLRMRLAHRLEDEGEVEEALEQLDAVLALRPGYQPARGTVKRLRRGAGGPGLFARLLAAFRGDAA